MLEDLADLEIYQALLTPDGVRGLVIECEDCHEPHYFDWDLLRGNLRHLLNSGRPRVHEPAYDPDPDHYVTWEYARGYADGVHDTLAEATASDEPDARTDTAEPLGAAGQVCPARRGTDAARRRSASRPARRGSRRRPRGPGRGRRACGTAGGRGS